MGFHTVVDIGWGEWGSRLRPPFFWAPPSKTAYTVLDSLQMFVQRTILSEDLFFFRERLDFERKIGKSEMKSKWRPFFFFFREHLDFRRKICKPRLDLFFSQTTSIFENSCLGPLNWNIHHWFHIQILLKKIRSHTK